MFKIVHNHTTLVRVVNAVYDMHVHALELEGRLYLVVRKCESRNTGVTSKLDHVVLLNPQSRTLRAVPYDTMVKPLDVVITCSEFTKGSENACDS
jgi:hypothetical protein